MFPLPLASLFLFIFRLSSKVWYVFLCALSQEVAGLNPLYILGPTEIPSTLTNERPRGLPSMRQNEGVPISTTLPSMPCNCRHGGTTSHTRANGFLIRSYTRPCSFLFHRCRYLLKRLLLENNTARTHGSRNLHKKNNSHSELHTPSNSSAHQQPTVFSFALRSTCLLRLPMRPTGSPILCTPRWASACWSRRSCLSLARPCFGGWRASIPSRVGFSRPLTAPTRSVVNV